MVHINVMSTVLGAILGLIAVEVLRRIVPLDAWLDALLGRPSGSAGAGGTPA